MDIAWRPVLRAARFLFWGVLLCGCAGPGPARERAAAPAHALSRAPLARRVGVHVPSVTGREQLQYDVRVDAALERIEVRLCASGFRIERLNAPSPGAARFLEGGKVVTQEGDATCRGDSEGVDLPATQSGECLSYAVTLPEPSPDATSLRRIGRDRLASPDLWLWVPTPRPEGLTIRARLELPEGVSAALPWPRLPQEAHGSVVEFSVPESAFAWKATGAFSYAAIESLSPEVDWVALGEGFAHAAAVRAWILEGARSASLLFGRLPVARVLLIAVPSERSGPAFGMALRGGGPAISVFLDRRADAAALSTDWTCGHEFLHLGVPHLPPEDAWLFEGLATYYTEVTRARAGLISSEQAYQHLLEGFERGRRAGGGLTLREESEQMHERRSFQRVYWAGAALALLTDLNARREGGRTLDSALRSFAECCAASEQEWTAERVLARLDASLGAPRFTELSQHWLDRREFPEVDEALRALGVAPGSQGRAVFGRGRDAALRDAIMARAPR